MSDIFFCSKRAKSLDQLIQFNYFRFIIFYYSKVMFLKFSIIKDQRQLTVRTPLWSIMEKNRQNSHLINYCPTSEGVSEVSERTNERTDERVAQYSNLYF